MKQHQFHPTILREYDIRGVFGKTLSTTDAYWIGRCLGHLVLKKGGQAIVVGRDGRLSSPELERSLVEGLTTCGLNVYRLGIVPTPVLYFAEFTLPVKAAIMVTGSHNPPTHNGFKISIDRKPFFGADISSLATLVTNTLSTGIGQTFEVDLRDTYIERLLQDIKFKKDLKIAWDSGNGATGEILRSLVKKLPGEHILLNTEIDGTFPSHPPDPSDPENLKELQQVVISNKCDIGIAFDGDGDRLGAIDENGNILFGDQLLIYFATELLKRKPNSLIITDVKASQLVFDEIAKLNGQSLMWKTGHSHIKSKMAETGAPLAGEMSGHFFFKEQYYGFDDGIYAALKLLEGLSQSQQTLYEFYAELPNCPSTPEFRIPCEAEKKFIIPENIKARLKKEDYNIIDIDGVRVQLKDGWWLLRASNTQDVLVARCGSTDKEGLENAYNHLTQELSNEKLSINRTK